MGRKCKLGRKRKYTNRKRGDRTKKNISNEVIEVVGEETGEATGITTNFDKTDCISSRPCAEWA